MDNGYFDLFAYKFRCWLGSVTRHIQNQQIKDYHYIGECGAKMTREEILKILKNIKNNVEHVDIHCKSQKELQSIFDDVNHLILKLENENVMLNSNT